MSLKMRGEVLDEVVRRLRSGKYKQGQSALRLKDPEGDAFCCLGVMCEMAVEEGVVERGPFDSDDRSYWYGDDEEGNNIYLPDKVVDWAGIVSDVEKEMSLGDYWYEQRGSFGEGEFDSLAVMNDDGKTFPEIADWMEANVERV